MAPDLTAARALIMAGQVVVDDQRADKPGALLAPGINLRLKNGRRPAFVSRGGEKLRGAVTDLGLAPVFANAVVLDVGASTGGFTQYCLELGAGKVIALDVGSNQLAWELRQDPRVEVVEQTDIRAFQPDAFPEVDIVVADISFNSLARLAPALRRAAPGAGARFLLLVKPQFELERHLVPTGGVVTDPELRRQACDKVVAAFVGLGLKAGGEAPSRLPGRTGNVEIFQYFHA